MSEQNALRLADQTILQLRRNKYTRAVWLVGDNITRTPTNDEDFAVMDGSGAQLVGVFGPAITRAALAEAIIETWRAEDE